MKISIKTNIAEVTKNLTRVQKKQIPYAASQTLNQLAFDLTKRDGKGVLGKATATTFDKKRGKGATPFTQKNFFYKNSNKENLTAWVFWDSKNADYMKFQVAGGTRFPRKRTLRVTTKHSNKYLNPYGNFLDGAISEMLEDKAKFFSGTPKGGRSRSEGIWERYGRSTKRGGQKIRKVVSFADKASYRPLFQFASIASKFVFSRSGGFESKFQNNLRRALAKKKK
jgi:hypothetical protein